MALILALIGVFIFIKGEVNLGKDTVTTKLQGQILGLILMYPALLFTLFDFSPEGVMITYLTIVISLLRINKAFKNFNKRKEQNPEEIEAIMKDVPLEIKWVRVVRLILMVVPIVMLSLYLLIQLFTQNNGVGIFL